MSSNTISPETLKTEYVLPEKCVFSLNPNGFLAAEIDGKVYKRVILTRSLPLSLPDEYICISDIEKNEVGIIKTIADFSKEQQELINSELSQRYYCPIISKIESIKEKIGYEGEWAAAYGMHPAVLQYNGIATLDGYLGLYSEEYKQQFGKLIAPALEESEEFYHTFWNSGIRAYLFSGAGENTYQPLKQLTISDTKLYIDGDVFREMNGTYLFSRIEISNADELGLELSGEYTHETSPYVIYVYKNK